MLRTTMKNLTLIKRRKENSHELINFRTEHPNGPGEKKGKV